LAGNREDITESADPDFVVAEVTFVIEHEGDTVDVPFVQFLRSRDGKIVSVREYFSPTARREALGES
jgi:ketosteroid isomerase-like protein